MGNRIIFTIKHEKKVLAYIYQNWGAGDGETIAEEVRKAASKYGLNISERAYNKKFEHDGVINENKISLWPRNP